MAILNTGKSFASGEQLTADKLNKMMTDATFNVGGAVDNATLTVNSGGSLAVNQITSSNIPNNAITTSDLAQLGNNQFLGRTSSGTGDVESVDISAIATLLRPKGTTATGGTTQTNGEDGNFSPAANVGNLNRRITTGLTDTDFVYNINEFTGTASDFHYSKITGIFIRVNIETDGPSNGISVVNSPIFGSRFILGLDHNDTNYIDIKPSFWIPINSDETTFTLQHVRGDEFGDTQHAIVGFTYIPALPEVTF